MDRRNADQRHRQLHLQYAGIDVVEPLGLVGVVVDAQARDEGLVATHDHHDQQVGDHHHVDQAEYHQHDLGLVEGGDMGQQVPDLDQEVIDVDALRDDQAEVKRQLEPARSEDDAGDGAERGV
ncbi:hypothetical protein D3C87_1321270 [compost metagenome]